MNTVLIFTHKYLGLFLGLLLSIIGLSGSLIVFDRELDEFLSPTTVDFEPAASLGSLDLAFKNARKSVNNGSEPTRIILGRHAKAPNIIRFPRPKYGAGPIEVSVDPGTSEVLTVRIWGEYPASWIYNLHYSLLTGKPGKYIVGVMGLCLLFFSISGVIIWWPRGKKAWRRAFTITRKAGSLRFFYDLHKTIGIYFLLVLMVLAFTGIKLVFHNPVENIIAAISPVKDYPNPQSKATTGGESLTVDKAATIAQSIFPNARLVRVYLPRTKLAAYMVTFIQHGELWNENDATGVWVDQYSGKILDVWDYQNLPVGSTFLEWMFPLHNGDALGIVGRCLVFIAGFLPTLLFLTGFYMWWKKRKATKL